MSEHLHIGWNPSLDVPRALRQVPVDRRDHLQVLISMVDSTPHVGRLPSLVPLLRKRDVSHVNINDDVLLTSEALLALDDEEQFFTGFDEVWLFVKAPVSSKPERLHITSDQPLASAPEGLEAWMRQVNCIAGLGDGDGLNFATFDPNLAALWR